LLRRATRPALGIDRSGHLALKPIVARHSGRSERLVDTASPGGYLEERALLRVRAARSRPQIRSRARTPQWGGGVDGGGSGVPGAPPAPPA